MWEKRENLEQIENDLPTNFKCLKVILGSWVKNLLVLLKFQTICSIKFTPFKTSRKLSSFKKNQFRVCFILPLIPARTHYVSLSEIKVTEKKCFVQYANMASTFFNMILLNLQVGLWCLR